MKKSLVVTICSVLLFLFGSNAYAVDLATCTMQATVIRQIVITETNGINFGNIYDTVAQTCTMNPADNSLAGTACGTAAGTAGIVHIEGAQSAAVDLEVIAGANVDNIAFVPAFDNVGTQTDNTRSLSAANPGTLDVNVGGLLTVGAIAPTAGVKNFTYTFRCTYQ